MTRYIKLYTNLADTEVFQDAGLWQLYSLLLMKMCFSKMTYRGVTVDRGQCLLSLNKIQLMMHCGKAALIKRLDKLQQLHLVKTENKNIGTLITVLDYDNLSAEPLTEPLAEPLTEPLIEPLAEPQNKNNKEKEINKEKEERERRARRYAEVVREDMIWTEQLAMRLHTTTDVVCRGIDEALQTFILDGDLPADLSNFKLRTRQYIDTHLRTIIRPQTAMAGICKPNEKLTSATDYERELYLAAGVEI